MLSLSDFFSFSKTYVWSAVISPSATKADAASYIVFALAISALTLAFLCIDKKFGIAIAANIAMIAITIISSINVKPFFFLLFLYNFIYFPPYYLFNL